jgi:hypothetical protein
MIVIELHHERNKVSILADANSILLFSKLVLNTKFVNGFN